MSGIARITFSGGERLMPARNGYDRELVFDEAECCARRHGAARLQLKRAAMVISVSPAEQGPACARCDRTADRLAFVIGTATLCRRCARGVVR